ncbi:MAG: MFS transporter [Gluconacetobacter diazotrophicus]|nr:MFS transporter [Gluconacetobacter diazotrophicus]
MLTSVSTARPALPRALRPVYAFGACWMGVPVMPVYVPFLLGRGLGTVDVLDLQAIHGIAVTVMEIPTGTICDWLGRRRTLVLGAICNVLGLCGFAIAHDFASYAAVQLLLAAGWSLVSGADVSLIYDVLDAASADRDARRRALAAYATAQVVGEAVASCLGGAVAALSLRAVGWLTAAGALLPLGIAAFLLPDGARRTASASATLAAIPGAARTVFADRTTALLFANAVVWGLSTFVAVWLLQPYWTASHVGLGAFGPLWAGTLLTVAIVSRAAPILVRRVGDRACLLLLAALPVGAYAAMAAFSGLPGVAAGFGFYVSRGLNAVVLREALNHRIPSPLRATFNSLSSGTSRLGFAILGPVIGLLVAGPGLRSALAALAALFGIAFLVLALPLVRRPPRDREARGA